MLDINLPHFRDPKVFWHAPTARWVMILALSDQNKISLYASPNLKEWRHLSDFGPAGAGGQLWECPDLFSLPVKSPGTDQVIGAKWILKVDMFEGGVAGGSSAQYFIGDFDGTSFIPDQTPAGEDLWDWADFGKDFYAAVTWSNLPEADGRSLWIGWMSNHVYGPKQPTAPWRGAMTLPRSLALEPREAPALLRLIQQPPAEVETLRRLPQVITATRLRDGEQTLATLLGNQDGVEIIAALSEIDADQCGFIISWDSGDELTFGYDRTRQALFLDRSNAGLLCDDPAFTGRRHAPLAQSATLPLRVFLDADSIEIFADGGAITLTELIFPRGRLASLRLFAHNGGATLEQGALWRLAAAMG